MREGGIVRSALTKLQFSLEFLGRSEWGSVVAKQTAAFGVLLGFGLERWGFSRWAGLFRLCFGDHLFPTLNAIGTREVQHVNASTQWGGREGDKASGRVMGSISYKRISSLQENENISAVCLYLNPTIHCRYYQS